MKNLHEAERSADSQDFGETDYSAYTLGDLIDTIKRLLFEAHYILTICEDLPPNALQVVCTNHLRKEVGDGLTGLLAALISLVPAPGADNDA